MRPSFLPVLLLTCIAFALAPARAQSGGDASGSFLDAFTSYQRGEKIEAGGDNAGALTAYKDAARMLDQIAARWPTWNPTIVEFRRKRAQEKVAALQGRAGASPAVGEGGGIEGAGTGNDVEPPLPGEGSLMPVQPEPAPEPAQRGNARRGATTGSSDPIQEIQDRMNRLQRDLQSSRDELEKMRREKEDLAKQLSDSNKVRDKAEEAEKVLKQRADNAEKALMTALAEGAKDNESVKKLQAEREKTRKDLRDLQIDREAAEEVRLQLASRLSSAQKRMSTLTKENESATRLTAESANRVAEAQKKVDKAMKENADLTTRLEKVTGERDTAVAQVTKMKESQKQVDKLITENTQLMAKLTAAEEQIGKFKAEGIEKDKTIEGLRKEVGTVKQQLADTQKQSQTYQTQMADLQGKLETTSQQLAQMKTDSAAGVVDRKKMQEENDLLRGIVMRQMKEQARRDSTRKLVLGELSKLEVKSRDLLTRINYLGQPIVKLSAKERALFKTPQIDISENEISIAAPGTDAAVAEAAPVPPGPDAMPASPEAASATAGALPAPAGDAAIPAATPPLPDQSGKTAAAAPVPAPAPVEPAPAPLAAVAEPPNPLSLELPSGPIQVASNTLPDTTPALEKMVENAAAKNAPAATGAPAGNLENPPAAGAATSAPKAPGMPQELLPTVQEAKDQFERGNYRESEKLYERILAKVPNNLYALSNLGVVRFRSGKLKLAEEAFRKAITVAPEDAFSHCTLGIVYYSQGKYDEAVNELTKALAIDPKNATAHNYLGITASQKGWQEAAQKELETATALDPTYADAHFNLAVVFATQQPPNKESARRHYKRATELGAEPDSALETLLK